MKCIISTFAVAIVLFSGRATWGEKPSPNEQIDFTVRVFEAESPKAKVRKVLTQPTMTAHETLPTGYECGGEVVVELATGRKDKLRLGNKVDVHPGSVNDNIVPVEVRIEITEIGQSDPEATQVNTQSTRLVTALVLDEPAYFPWDVGGKTKRWIELTAHYH